MRANCFCNMQKNLQAYIAKYKPKIDRVIEEELSKRLAEVEGISPHLAPILGAMQELSVGGKRLRGLLSILGYELAGHKVNDQVIRAAVVMELFHLGLLIQDDWMDRDNLRRGVATIHSRYPDLHTGNFVAMLAGDYTFGWVIEVLSTLSLDPVRVNAGMAVWGKYFTRVGYGQTLDGLDIADDQTILQILAIKSGEYSCALPLLLGATLGGADHELSARLERYGMAIGWVFQLRDDYLGYAKDMAKKGKKTYATMYGIAKTEEMIAKYMEEGTRLAQGNPVMEEIVVWLGTRDN